MGPAVLDVLEELSQPPLVFRELQVQLVAGEHHQGSRKSPR
jgi:hypothetical protein